MGRQNIEVADIMRKGFYNFQKNRKLPVNKIKAVDAIIKCRTAALGGHTDACDECGSIRISYNSCRNRHCPKCQFLAKEKWLHKRMKELLPVQYFHVVFTVPNELNLLMLNNPKEMYKLFFKAASQTVIDLANDKFKATTGMLAILHTWGQNLSYHPHLHCVIPGGGLSDNKQKWVHSKKKYLLPVKIMSAVFKGKFLELLKKAYKSDSLKFTGEISNYSYPNRFKALLESLYSKSWVVYTKKPFGGPEKVLKYLGRYTHRIAIANKRILRHENDKVTFIWKDYKDSNKKKIMTLNSEEFIRRFMLHILPSGFFKIRYFGILSNRIRKEMTDICRKILNVKEIFGGIAKDWKDFMLELTGVDVRICPCCGKGNMITVSSAHPP